MWALPNVVGCDGATGVLFLRRSDDINKERKGEIKSRGILPESCGVLAEIREGRAIAGQMQAAAVNLFVADGIDGLNGEGA